MRHTGVILETKDHAALVRLSGAEECQSCGACGSAGELGKQPQILVDNPIQAKPGQLVLVEFDPVQTVKSGLLVFMVPVVALLVGALAGRQVGGTDSAAVLGAVAALGLSALGVILYDRRLSRHTPVRPRTIEVLPADQLGEHCEIGVVQELLRR